MPIERRSADAAARIPCDANDPLPVIQASGLTTRYDGSRGIEDLTLTMHSGEIFGFIGANGAGKTTTIRTLVDLLRPTSGSAQIFGLDSRRDAAAIHARIGNLPGGFGFDDSLSGAALLKYLAALRGMRGLGRADELAGRLRADLQKPLGALSRGNRQKVGVIQAMFHEPDLLILDEPTSGLDPLMQEVVLELLAEERAAGRSVFISSHNLAEVQRICDRVAIIRDGRLLAVENVADLTERAYRRVSVSFADRADPELVASLPGVGALEAVGDDRLRFNVRGDLNKVLRALTSARITDITIEPPDLEDAFLAYYEAAEPAA